MWAACVLQGPVESSEEIRLLLLGLLKEVVVHAEWVSRNSTNLMGIRFAEPNLLTTQNGLPEGS